MDAVKIIALLVLVIAAAVIDTQKGIIPNKLVLCGLAFLCGWLLVNRSAMLALAVFYGGLAGGVPILLIIFATRGGIGSGDMKLLTLVGGFVGAEAAVFVLMLSVVSAGLWALVLLIAKAKTLTSKIPFAPFIAIATFAVVFFQDAFLQIMPVAQIWDMFWANL